MPKADSRKKPKMVKSMALVPIPRETGKRGRPAPGVADRKRWVMFKVHGKPVEEIANICHCSPIAVQESIDYMEQYRLYYSNDLLETKIRETAMERMDAVGTVFDGGLKANKSVQQRDGRSKSMPDWGTRLKTVETMKSLIESVQPKAAGIQLNQQFNNGQGGPGFGPGLSFEAMLRKKREAAGMANDQEVDIIDAEVSQEDEIEDEFADFGGSGDEDEDEEGDERAE